MGEGGGGGGRERKEGSGVSSEVLRVLEHPPQLLASFFSRLASIVIYPIKLIV